ncbi:hypothetical protein HJFPF1_06175 [Paramyrothecium foliicola]|nr:hypothetical protein HJFPF1_06175 [Paramyrothecium foliicola]
MQTAFFSTAPRIGLVIHVDTLIPHIVEGGVVTWRVPLGGELSQLAIGDSRYCVKRLLDHVAHVTVTDLDVAIEHTIYSQVVEGFSEGYMQAGHGTLTGALVSTYFATVPISGLPSATIQIQRTLLE